MEINSIFFINIIFEALSFVIMIYFLKLFFNYKFVHKTLPNILLSITYGIISISAAAVFDLVNFKGAPVLAVGTELLRTFLLIAIETLFLFIIFRINFIRLFVYNLFFLMISGIGNALSLLVFMSFGMNTEMTYISNHPSSVLLGQLITNLVLVAILLLIYFFKVYKYINIKSRLNVMTIFGTFCVFAINLGVYIVLLRQYKLSIWYFIIISILLIAYGLLNMFFLRRFRYFENKEIELKQQVFYNNSLKNTMDGFRRYKHNYNNNLMVISTMLKMDKIKELKLYMDDLLTFNNKINIESVILNINNAALHGLVMSKVAYAEAKQVDFKICVPMTVSDINGIKMLELCEILGILLDNAIEAVMDKTKKEVEFIIESDEEALKFEIKNFFDGSKDEFYTVVNGSSSSKGSGHGNGIKIIKAIVKQNKHVLFNTYLFKEEKILSQEIIIITSPS